MYEAYYGLNERPFSLVPDPEFFYPSAKHSLALSLFEYSVSGQAGFCVISGEVGAGKTTLIRRFIQEAPEQVTFGLISNPHVGFGDLLDWVLAAFHIPRAQGDKVESYLRFLQFLEDQAELRLYPVLIVDEAQNLTLDVLEQLRLLSNVNSDKQQLLQVVLVGQPELLERLRDPRLSQFAQRVSVHHHLGTLSFAETRDYIRHRLALAGADREIFEELAIAAVQYFAGGVPRLINSICDMALVYGYAGDQGTISLDTIFEVVRDREKSGILALHRRMADLERADIVGTLTAMIRESRDAQRPRPAANESDPQPLRAERVTPLSGVR
ncbi:MAG: AAA family ATPase [Alphaproteobacteria bacterium]